MLKMFKLEAFSPQMVTRHAPLISLALNGNTIALNKQLEKNRQEIGNPFVDKALQDNIIQLILENSKFSKDKQNEIIKLLIKHGAEYRHYLIDSNVDFKLMKRIISDCGGDPNKDYQGLTALHAVIVSSQDRAAKMNFLLEKGANINTQDRVNEFDNTPIHAAIANEDFELAAEFIDRANHYHCKIDYSVRDKEGKTLLILAAKVMSLALVKKILAADPTCVNLTDNQGRTALHFACILGQWTIAKALIEAGADINIQDKQGNTAAHYAVSSPLVIRATLLSVSIDPDRDEKAPSNAVTDLKGKAVVLPLNHPGAQAYKMTACPSEFTNKKTQGEVQMSCENKLTLRNSFTVLSQPEREHLIAQISVMTGTSITQACVNKQKSVVNLLIQHKADLTLKNKFEKTPAEVAEVNGLKQLSILFKAESQKQEKQKELSKEEMLQEGSKEEVRQEGSKEWADDSSSLSTCYLPSPLRTSLSPPIGKQ